MGITRFSGNDKVDVDINLSSIYHIKIQDETEQKDYIVTEVVKDLNNTKELMIKFKEFNM